MIKNENKKWKKLEKNELFCEFELFQLISFFTAIHLDFKSQQQ